jgi:hypothetical protein
MKNFNDNDKIKDLNKEGEYNNDQQSKKRDFKKKLRLNKSNGSRRKENGNINHEDKQSTTRVSINDPKWYALNENVAKAVGSIPYNVFAGERVNLLSKVGNNSKDCVPGVMILATCHMPGKSTSASSAINIMSKAVYSFVRHQNSGHTNYESSDLTMYILAMDEVYTRYLELKRIYGIAMTYDYVNRNVPDIILRALRVDPDNIRANLAQFRYGLNIRAAKISSLAVPANFNLFKRHAVLASTVLMDSSSMRSQFYLWTQAFTHKYDPTAENGGALIHKRLKGFGENPDEYRTYEDLLAELDDILDPIISDEDMNIMSGDILKAYGKENLFVLQEVNESETANFIFDENMLAQIENSSSEVPYFDEGLDITQQNNLIISNPTFQRTNYLTNRFFNSHKDNPDAFDTLEWSRGMTMNGLFGTEIIAWYTIYARAYNNDGTAYVSKLDFGTYQSENDAGQNQIQLIAQLSVFDWHPIIYYFQKVGDDFFATYSNYIGDLKKFTLIGEAEVARLHDSAVMGELNGRLLEHTSY